MRNCLLVIFIIYFLQVSNAQQNLEYTGSIEVNGYGVSEGLPFWLRTNTKGFLGVNTQVASRAILEGTYALNNNHQLSAGASLLARDGFNETLNRNNLFLGYKNSFFEVVLGAKNRSVSKEGLSTINDDILYSGNARALPGVLLKTSKPIKIGSHIGIDLDLAHYVLNDSRATKNVNVHYKMLRINYKIKQKHTIAAALRHYVQWGGTLTSGRELPSNFDSYLRVFFGSNGGSESSFSDQVNAIGNHIGSYQVDYKYESEKTIINLYYQSIFEDRSGRELANFPDGVWGIYFKNQDKKLFQSFLYEFIHTISQSGNPIRETGSNSQQSGGDNYFINGSYPSGWTYDGLTIGLPFITPIASEGVFINNRSIAHHLGSYGFIGKWNHKTKMSYVTNRGTYGEPIEAKQKQLLMATTWVYSTQKYGELSFYGGIDFLNDQDNRFGGGLGYKYIFK